MISKELDALFSKIQNESRVVVDSTSGPFNTEPQRQAARDAGAKRIQEIRTQALPILEKDIAKAVESIRTVGYSVSHTINSIVLELRFN